MIRKQASGQKDNGLKKSRKNKKNEQNGCFFIFLFLLKINFNFGLKCLNYLRRSSLLLFEFMDYIFIKSRQKV